MLQTGVLELFAGKAAHLLLARLMGSNVLLAGVCRKTAKILFGTSRAVGIIGTVYYIHCP